MFWRLGFQQNSPIDAILEREKFDVEDLLDEDDLLQECKSYNRKLINYLSTPDVVAKLIQYSTTEPSPDAEAKVRLKYPHIATEILTGDMQVVYDCICSNDHLTQQLYQFLDGSGADNALLAGYFCKIVVALLGRKPTETLAVLKNNDVLGACLQHLRTFSMVELILRVVLEVEDNASRSSAPVEQWLVDYGLMQRLVSKLDASNSAQIHQNVGNCLASIARESSRAAPSVFVSQLASSDVVKNLLDNVFSGSSSALMAGLNVLVELLKVVPPSVDGPNPLITEVLARLGDFVKLLENPPPMAPITNTAETLNPPLGANRLMVVEVLLALVATSDAQIEEAVNSSGVVFACLDLFVKYAWNNLLHNLVEKMMVSVLSKSSSRIRAALFETPRFIEWIVAAHKKNEECVKKIGTRIGFAAQLLNITNAVIAAIMDDESLSEKVKSMGGSAWEVYLRDEVLPRNELERRQLGGHKPFMGTRGGMDSLPPPMGSGGSDSLEEKDNNNNDNGSDPSWRPRDSWLTEEESSRNNNEEMDVDGGKSGDDTEMNSA